MGSKGGAGCPLAEVFVWKFSNPYFRRTLAPLYFPSRPKACEAA